MEKLDRKNSYDRKWNMEHLREKYHVEDNVIPNHVADFDYPTPEFIFDQIKERCNFKSLSYFSVDEEFYDAFKFWYKEMKNIEIEKGWINYSYGVFFSMAAILNTKTNIGDSILINTPCYSPFVRVCLLNDRKPIMNKLILKNNKYELDLYQIEKDIIENNIKLFLFCNPLNPTGRLWTLEELNAIASICKKHNVILVSDEVHGDLVSYKEGFNTVLKTNEEYKNNVIVFSSATKAFNIGGMSSSYMISKNIDLLKELWSYQEKIWLGNSNVFGVEVMKAAYTQKGIEWSKEMSVHHNNMFELTKKFVEENDLPLKVLDLHAGFCVSVVVEKHLSELEKYKKEFIKNGLLVRFSNEFYDYDNFWFRIILSTDEKTIKEILERIKKVFKK
ncbi:aminotransferase class I/II-fold pyridoxal phosphate-dependent enzyme [Mesoplasma photuris]|uniref:aminotransferase class I/II-fold pyridoxal phosphate-dependent enzyme n=1 Tax=Mesoplasma photuris TaxID=217731 RepID=UPI0004E0FEED|nr:aminotransferase class I/II-fold pyridoxal phosphate-dependent enzyme [Mesoplasma photuris]